MIATLESKSFPHTLVGLYCVKDVQCNSRPCQVFCGTDGMFSPPIGKFTYSILTKLLSLLNVFCNFVNPFGLRICQQSALYHGLAIYTEVTFVNVTLAEAGPPGGRWAVV